MFKPHPLDAGKAGHAGGLHLEEHAAVLTARVEEQVKISTPFFEE